MNQVDMQQTGFETVFRHSKDGLAIFKDGVFVDCNQSMLELVGLQTKEQFLGLTPFDFSPEYQFDGRTSVEKGMEYINRCYEEGSVRFEWIHQKLTGEPFWCEVIITKMVLNGDVVVHANWRNITEKKDLELKLAEQKKTFETLFNESLDGLSIFDANQHYIDCNQAFLDMLGFTRKEEVIGLHPTDISPEFQANGRSSKTMADAKIQNLMNEGSDRFEWIHRKVDGKLFWTEVIITKVRLNASDAVYAVVRDISEKKQLELQLYERNAELDQSNNELAQMLKDLQQTQDQLIESEKLASLGALVAGVSHEINTPVSVGLMGITQLMEENEAIRKRYQNGELDESVFEEFLATSSDLSKIVHKNLDRTAQLIRGFKQIAVDQTSQEERSINLKQYLEEIVFSLSSVTRKANATITIDCDPHFNVITHPGLISQVLTNLIVNSIQHGFIGRDHGKIAITVRDNGDNTFVLTYQDDGKGISKQNLSKIFDPFFTTSRASGGTGLGLNVTYNIVKNALHGSIECCSQENEGVKFTIHFKVKERV
ncbi:PAS domain-containing sensor histidine kinase [Vibrio ostreae]|uniref:histidine kinase n=1 Tax=Vibrio ostreae TaxID=2841925 RepID=A0A975YLZ2_9VIBR|nr:PAS domain-containing sensor histidine kinase [Vibrio ostreae]QXO16172.1 PAS domain-containing sensor histidine kinase [Vibrio ostreae]